MNTDKGRLYFGTGIDNSRLRIDADESKNILHGIGTTAVQEGHRMDASFSKIAKAVGGVFAVSQITQFAKEIINVRGEIESLEISFQTLAGKTKGDALFKDIRQFAVSTPMMVKDLAAGAQTMLAFNIETEKVMPMLRAIGDISMGDAQKFNSLTLAFSQMSATGKLMGQDLLQMINAGFNPLSVISEKTGKSIGELKEEMEKGKISADMIAEAFIAATSAGGKFNGMLEKQSHGINGAISNMQGAIEDMLNDFGSATQGVTMSAIDSVTFLAKNYKDLSVIIASTVAAYGAIKTVLIINEALERANIAARAEKIAAIEAEIAAVGHSTSAQAAATQANVAELAAKHNLTQAEAAHIVSLQAEAAARIKSLQTAVASAAAETTAAVAAEKSARAQLFAAAQILRAKEAELVAAKQSGDIFAISAAQKEVDAAATSRDAAASNLNAASKAVESARAKEVAAAEAVETAGHNLNGVALDVETRKVGVLGLAKTALTKIVHRLNAAIMANPWMIAAAAVGALAYGIYKLVTYETEAEKAQRKLNEAVGQAQAEIDAERIKIDALFSALENTTKGTKAYESAKDAIIKQYGQYLEGLVNEQGELLNVAEAYNRVRVAAESAAKARALEATTKDAQDEYQNTVNEKYSGIADKIRGRVRNSDLADTLIQLVNNDMSNGGVITNSTLDAINKAFGVDKAKNGKWELDSDVGAIKLMTADIRKAGKRLAQATHDAQIKFGAAINEFEDYTLEQLRDAQKQLSEDLDDTSATNFSILGGGVMMKDVNTRPDALLALQKLNAAIASKSSAAATAKTEAEYSKKDWEDYKKAKQGEYDAMTEAERISSKGRALEAEIIRADSKIKGWDVTGSAKRDAADVKNANHTAVEIAERNRAIEEAKKAEIKANRDAALEVRQERLNLEADSTDKVLQQIEIDKQRMENALSDREDALLEKYRDIIEKQWQNANPDAKDKGMSFDRTSVSKADMLQAATQDGNEWLKDALANIAASRKVMESTIAKQTKDAYDDMLKDVLTYEQQRTKISEEYARKRDALYEKNDDGSIKTDADGNKVLRSGVTQGNIDELDRQETNALSAIDEQFAQREETYKAWCEEIANLSLQQLNEVLDRAKKNLEELEKNSPNDPKIAQARAKVAFAQNAVNKANAKNQTNPSKRSIKEWQDLYKTLNDVKNTFEEMGDTIGGTIGEIVSECGQFATSALTMINGIVQLTQMSATSIQGTAVAGATAISTMEKASIILTIISAAMQIAMQIVNLFNSDGSKQKEIEGLQDRIDQLQWELDHQEVGRMQREYGKSIDILNKALRESRRELAAGKSGWAKYIAMMSSASRNQDLMTKTLDKLTKAYGNMSYTVDKALGAEKYKQSADQLKKIAEQQILIQEQINAEQSKKKSDAGQIEEWKRKIEELGHEAIEIINEMVEDIIGDTSTGIAEKLADSFFEAFAAGEDAAKAWGNTVNEIVADILKRMLVSKFLEEPLGEIFDKYKAKWFKDGQFQGIDAVTGSMNDFSKDLNEALDAFEKGWRELPDDLKEKLKQVEETTQQSSTGSYGAELSEDTGTLINGRLSAIQVCGEMRRELLLKISEEIAAIKEGIETNAEIAAEMRDLLMIAISHLDAIVKNTNELYEINERLAKIEKNTRA